MDEVTIGRTEILKRVFGDTKAKGTQEYNALAKLVWDKQIPFVLENEKKVFKESDFDIIKYKLLSYIDEINNPKYISSLSFSQKVSVSKSTMQVWCDAGLVPGYVQSTGILVDKIEEATKAVEKLKQEKINILGKHQNEAHQFPCKVCGNQFAVKPSHYDKNQKITCSDECWRKYIKEQKVFHGTPANKPIILNDYIRDVIYGELLGDGCIYSKNKIYKGANSVFSYGTSKKEYIQYLKNVLECLNIPKIYHYETINKKQDKILNKYMFCSEPNPTLTKIYEKWYQEGKKIVPEDIELTPTICLHWYIGDGGLSNSNKEKNNEDNLTQRITLYTNSFNEKSVDILVNKLNILGFQSYKYLIKIRKNRFKEYLIIIPSKTFCKFLDYIGECPVECYKYKWNIINDNFKLYEKYCYSTGDVAKKLGKEYTTADIRGISKTQWFKKSNIDCIKMWSRTKFSEEGFQQLKVILESRKNCRNINIYN